MGIQSSVNALMQQLYTIGAISAGLREQKEQTKAAVASTPSFPERFRKAFNIDDKATLTKEQERAIKWGMKREKETGRIVHPGAALWQARHMEVKNEIASDLARGSVEARTDSINKTKSNFDEHTASLIKYYSKGSGNP